MQTIAKGCKYFAALLLVIFACSQACATDTSTQNINSVIAEATDYNLVKPKYALATLESHKSLLKEASMFQRYMYFKTAFTASVYLYDSRNVFYYLQQMLANYQFPNNEPYFSDLMYSFSIWYGINQQYVSATRAGMCAMDFARSDQERIRSSIALGLTYLMTSNYPAAKHVLELNLEISGKDNNPKLVSAANNNLALFYIFTGQYHLAEQHLRIALSLNEKLARANGTALNLSNLLLVYYLQQDWQTFSRLINRAKRATDSLNNLDLKHYVAWLNSSFKIKTKQSMSFEHNVLLEHYAQVREPMIIKLIGVLANDLEIDLPVNHANQFGEVVDFDHQFSICHDKQ